MYLAREHRDLDPVARAGNLQTAQERDAQLVIGEGGGAGWGLRYTPRRRRLARWRRSSGCLASTGLRLEREAVNMRAERNADQGPWHRVSRVPILARMRDIRSRASHRGHRIAGVA